jgi:hypothetical protein
VTEQVATEPAIQLDEGGRYIGANQAALDLLGVSLQELLDSPPDRFAIRATDHAEQAAFRAEWESEGSRPLIGTAGLKRADGTEIRVSYAIEATPRGFTARLREVEGSPLAPPSVFTVGAVLREWRAAERSLAELHPGSEEWARTMSEIDLLRSRYHELFRSHGAPAD